MKIVYLDITKEILSLQESEKVNLNDRKKKLQKCPNFAVQLKLKNSKRLDLIISNI